MNSVVTVVGAIANVVMAYAAVAALNLWRKQIAGASHHGLAKSLSMALRQARLAREATLGNLRRVGSDGFDGQLARLFAPNWFSKDVQTLEAAATTLTALELEIGVHWGDVMVHLVRTIRSETSLLAAHAKSAFAPNMTEDMRVFLASWPSETGFAPFTGRAFGRALDVYTDLAEKWLAVHLGHAGATPMSTEELELKCKQVDEEAARLAEPEKAAVEAQQQKWVADHGGDDGMCRLFGEQGRRWREALETRQAGSSATSELSERGSK